MRLNINATGANAVPFPVGILEKEESKQVVVVVHLSGNAYSASQLDAILNAMAGKKGFEWLKPSGTLWSIDAGKLCEAHSELRVIPWFKGKLETVYETQFGSLRGSMGNHSSEGRGLSVVGHHPLTALAFVLDEEVASDSNRVFYSWMSDRDNFSNRSFIQDCLEKAVKLIAKDGSIGVTPALDRDTQGESGSPDIAATIFRKIARARAVVADVTLVNSRPQWGRGWLASLAGIGDMRLSPNPNVLVELGYAAGQLGWERCLLVVNTAFGPVEQLPFDLRGRRILPYKVERKADREAARTSLIPFLKNQLVEAMELTKTS